MVERAVDRLPAPFRMVFILRTMEQLSIHETADTLGIPAATVKTRLHRAVQLLRHALGEELATALDGAFPFDGGRCDRLTVSVLRRLALSRPGGNLFDLAPVQ
jgi:RNA polymerase sigma-70 factor (ECF subfamily)